MHWIRNRKFHSGPLKEGRQRNPDVPNSLRRKGMGLSVKPPWLIISSQPCQVRTNIPAGHLSNINIPRMDDPFGQDPLV